MHTQNFEPERICRDLARVAPATYFMKLFAKKLMSIRDNGANNGRE